MGFNENVYFPLKVLYKCSTYIALFQSLAPIKALYSHVRIDPFTRLIYTPIGHSIGNNLRVSFLSEDTIETIDPAIGGRRSSS